MAILLVPLLFKRVEGLHGAAFAKPLSRLRENIESIRTALSGEKLAYEGEHYELVDPWPPSDSILVERDLRVSVGGQR